MFSRGDPYVGESARRVLLAVSDPARAPEFRPAVSPEWPAAVQALMQVRGAGGRGRGGGGGGFGTNRGAGAGRLRRRVLSAIGGAVASTQRASPR